MSFKINRPYPFFLSARESFWVIAFLGLFTMTVCLVLRPFELASYDTPLLLIASGLNGLTVFISLLLSHKMFRLVFKKQNEETWTVLKEGLTFIWHIVFLSLFAFAINTLLDPSRMDAALWFQYGMVRPLLGSFIIIPVLVVLKGYLVLKKDANDTRRIQDIIGTQVPEPEDDGQLIELISNEKNGNFKVVATDIVYLKASENYVEVFYCKDGGLESVLLRNTLKSIHFQFEDHPSFFQCHRSYIINLKRISGFNGNAKGYLTRFKGLSHKIPVSRSKITDFERRIQTLSK